jgi:phosphatidylserine/phosphatidylglycerophosphate/cardiolipin synthase-like enzyme
MRRREANGPLSVHAIAGTYVVLLGIDMDEAASSGVLGFAIERTDHTEDERYWLRGLRTFEQTDPGVPGLLVSTLEHPFQSFLWGDYTAKTRHSYTYRIVAMRGEPSDLVRGEEVEVQIETEDDAADDHAVFFNRGVAGSQAYARKFGDKAPSDVPNGEAWKWLSRGLEEALIAFIGQAQGERYALRAALYEFQYEPVLNAFKAASEGGADVQIVYDDRQTGTKKEPAEINRQAIERVGIEDLVIPRTATPSYISHNKFIILLEDGEPRQVWTGSTNITAGGIFGHSNVGHQVRDPEVAAKYLDYWQELSGDPEASDLRPLVEAATPVPQDAPEVGTTVLFSPRSSLQALEWYARRMGGAEAGSAVFLTAAFGISEQIERVLEEERDYLRYLLLEKEDEDMEVLSRNPNNRFAVGATYKDVQLGRLLLAEHLTGLNRNVLYVHTKYALVDPLSSDPLLITGSANFSEPSTEKNDENMLIIRGDERVADVYLGEFMRIFNHFFVRDLVRWQQDPSTSHLMHLVPDDSWRVAHYRDGPQQKERVYFAGR